MKFTDHKSPEKVIINDTFKTIPYMDMWISSIVEGYIYEKVYKLDYEGHREEYTERYGKKEGEFKRWHRGADGQSNGQLWFQTYYKEGKLEGEYKRWSIKGQLIVQTYYKEGKEDGDHKWWGNKGQLMVHRYYKEGIPIKDLILGIDIF
jgi:antitoxin component YwqK of YwqJK toxin-antitoxin module